jgi:LuxR family maltose regulon positive regulatory protein
MSGYPIQPAKVQRPPLRDETLARDRLLDWLAAKIHQRVILVLADAGYGKTTLLADFSQRTRLRTLWYRLDDEDRDWISFLSHLVAAGREHDPEFAPTTAAMLSDLATGGPTREAATDVFLRELPKIAEHGAVLILDDFHLVDESPDIRIIARDLVARAPERLSIVFASRQTPPIPFARMRASGEVAEIGTDDEVFATVDALFTALTCRDDSRLDDCEERLLAFREAEQMPEKAADYLDAVIDQARSGEWEPAAKRLYDFMYRQRREGSTR